MPINDFYSIQKKIRNQNKIPESMLEDAFVYSLYDSTSGGDSIQVDGITQIIKSLTGPSQNITFTITAVGIAKVKWGDTGIQKTMSSALKQISSSLTIPKIKSYSFSNIFSTGGFIVTKHQLEQYTNEQGIVIPRTDNSFFIQEAGEMNIGVDGSGYFKLQSMNSYQWSTTKMSTGETIWKEIELRFGDVKGVMVDEIILEFTGPFRASKGMISMQNEMSIKVDFDIDFSKSFFELHESGIEHINTIVSSTNSLIIISHTMSALKISDILLNDHIGFQGKAPILNKKITGIGVPGSSQNVYATGGEYPLFYHEHSEEKKQLDTEWYADQDYYNILDGYPFISGFFVAHFLSPYWDTAIYEIIPNNNISELSCILTTSSGWQSLDPYNSPNYNFKNENKDLNSWFTSDYKLQWEKSAKKLNRASIVMVKPKNPWQGNRKEWGINFINNFINGTIITYKGMIINPLPDILKNNTKGEYQTISDKSESDINWFVISSIDPITYYNSKKDYYEIISPTKYKNEFIYDNQQGDLGKKTKRWPLPLSFQNLDIQLSDLFIEDKIKRKITIKLRKPQPFPKTFTLRLIGGGFQFSLIQKYENKRAVDKDGKPVPIIYKQLNWYKNRNMLLTKTSFDTI